MRLRVWGCRGSLASPGPATVGYGGNSSCVEVRAHDGSLIVLDAGTGIRPLGASLSGEPIAELDLLLTHLHLDHIEGLAFFAPLFDPGCKIRIWGPRPGAGSLRDAITTWLSPPYFPVRFEQIPADISFTEVWEDTWRLGNVEVTSMPVSHPGPTVGYRLTENGSSLAYIPDNEPALDPESGLALAQGVDLLLHDAQFTDEEYASRTGWGHSALSDFVGVLAATTPRQALMFHHDPGHSDDQLEALLAAARAASGHDQLDLAREGLEVALGAPVH
jgi:phosphoribosyl 1,2-cyclic phosphodiesterase